MLQKQENADSQVSQPMLNVNSCRHEVWQHPSFSSRRSWSRQPSSWDLSSLQSVANFSHSLMYRYFSTSSFDTFAVAWHWAILSNRCTGEKSVQSQWQVEHGRVVIGGGELLSSSFCPKIQLRHASSLIVIRATSFRSTWNSVQSY